MSETNEAGTYAANPQTDEELMFWNMCAAVAMKGYVVRAKGDNEQIARWSFDHADAMLAEQRRRLERTS